MISQKSPLCDGCPLQIVGKGFLQPEGKASIPLLITGEAAGETEARDSLPFRPSAPAGSILERAIRLCGFDREQFVIQNIVNCQPPRNELEGTDYELQAINHCKVHFDRVVEQYRPKVILALGNVALRTLTGMAGKYRTISHLRGYVLESTRYPGLLVIPSYHPSFIQRGGKKLLGVLMADLSKAVQLAQGKLKADVDYMLDPLSHNCPNVFDAPTLNDLYKGTLNYIVNPSVDQATKLINYIDANPDLMVSFDIENPKSIGANEDELDTVEMQSQPITQIQFSIAQGSGVAFPWQEPFISIAKQILATPNPKCGHNNFLYDSKVLKEKYGFTINGLEEDTMVKWRRLQPDLPADLQFVASFCGFKFPWKHYSGSDLAFYGIADVDATLTICKKLDRHLKSRGLENSYYRQTLGLRPILVAATERGIPINKEKLDKFGTEIEVEKDRLLAELQGLIPEELKSIHPTQGYKRDPKEVQAAAYEFNRIQVVDSVDNVHQIRIAKFETSLTEDEFIASKTGLVKRRFSGVPPEKGGSDNGNVYRWCRVEPFLPNSSKQVLAYIKHRKHQVPTKLNSIDETTAAKELERLFIKTGDPVYDLIIKYRELNKMYGTYYKNFQPDEQGRIRADFTFKPATGQLATANGPAILTSPKHGKLAARFRECFEAEPNHRLVEFDYKSFHALTLGFEAGDKDYMRLARLDIHSYVAAHLMKVEGREHLLNYTDEKLKEALDYLKKEHPGFKATRDKKAKPSILGIGFGLGAKKLYDMNRESFTSQKEAMNILSLIKSLFPKIFQYQERTKKEANDKGFLKTRYGYQRWFWDVYHWNAKYGRYDSGEDAEKAIAFKPANDAFGTIREVLLRLESRGLLEKYQFINTIHDSLVFHCPDEYLDECLREVKLEMEKPSEVLVDPVVAPTGLVCDVEVSI